MNEDQYTTAINSIATELHRLGHTQCQQPDEEQLFDLGLLGEILALCNWKIRPENLKEGANA
jgi:hypothetical protein